MPRERIRYANWRGQGPKVQHIRNTDLLRLGQHNAVFELAPTTHSGGESRMFRTLATMAFVSHRLAWKRRN